MLFKTVVLGKALGSSLGCREIKPLNPKGNQSWMFIGRTDAEAETPIIWPPYAKNWLIGKDPDAGKDWRREEKGMTEDEMIGWHPTWRTWVWESSGSWWWTGKPGVLQSMGSQRARLNWVTELKGSPGPPVDSASQASRSWVWDTDWLGTRGWSAEGKETVTPLTLFCPLIPVMSLGVWMIKIMLIFLLGCSPFF